MNKWKQFFEKIKTPKLWVLILVIIFSVMIIASTIVLAVFQITDVWVYAVYVLAFVALAYDVYLIVCYAPTIKQKCLETALKNKFLKKFIENYGFKSLVTSSFGFVINVGFAITQAVFAILAHSVWYGALAVYYICLSLIKGGILFKHSRRKRIENDNNFLTDQVKSYRNGGWYLTALTFAMSGAIVQMVIANQGFKYAGLFIYVMATYTFYKLTMCIINIVKALKHKDYTIQSIRNLNLASTLVTLLALQTAMFDAFGNGYNPAIANALTGGAVTLVVLAIAIIMIVKGNKKLKQLKGENDER